MSVFVFVIDIWMTFAVKKLTESYIVLIKEVGLSDGNPVECRFLCKLDVKCFFEILVNRRSVVARIDRCREQSYIIEHVRIVS